MVPPSLRTRSYIQAAKDQNREDVVELLNSVGVPEIVPSVVSNDRPAERLGEMDHVTTAPPLMVGVTDVMAVPLVSVKESGS